MLTRKQLLASARSFTLSDDELHRQIHMFYSSLDHPIALSCYLLWVHGEHDQLAEKEVNPFDFNSPVDFRDAYIACSYLRKADFLKTSYNRRDRALSSFIAAELQCRETNRRFSNLALDPKYKGSNVWLLHALTQKIASVLEPWSKSHYVELLDSGAFGPGVSYHLRGRDTSAARKFREELGITTQLCAKFWTRRRKHYPLWFSTAQQCDRPLIQDSSQVTTVPKNAKTDRTIAIEPGINLWFQKGLGKMVRRRLRKCGFDLNSDVKNQRQAYLGSISNEVATIDMKAASDTIARRVVEEILPHDWFSALESCRCREYSLADITHPYEKFSSMGNGFTFELESLIFGCAALVVCQHLHLPTDGVSVFGDDLVVPVQAVVELSEFLDFLGFTVNGSKSFSSGYFRESCGSYYFDGLDCKPYFLKKKPKRIYAYYVYLNSIRSLSHRLTQNIGCDKRFLQLYRRQISSLPAGLRLRGCKGIADGCIWSNFDEARPSKLKWWLEGFTFRAFTQPSVAIQDDSAGLLAARLFSGGEQAYGNNISLRQTTHLRLNTLIAPQWYNFGPWI